MAAIIVLVILGILAYDFYQRFYKPGIITQHWPELARHTGLTYDSAQGPWSTRRSAQVTGKYRGYDIKLDLARIVPGPVDDGIAAYHTRIVLTPHRRVNGSVSVEAKGFFSREGLKIDDEAFDRRFTIDSRPKDLAGRIFASDQLRQRFLQANPRKFRLSDLGLRLEFNASTREAATLRALLSLACDVANAIQQE